MIFRNYMTPWAENTIHEEEDVLSPAQATTWPDDLCGKGSYELLTGISSNEEDLSIFTTDAAAASLMALSQHSEFSSGSTINKKERNSNYQNWNNRYEKHMKQRKRDNANLQQELESFMEIGRGGPT
jgi:hypothetical protein